jgi:hypothetical protein
MDSLGEDLVLLSIRPDKGTVTTGERIGFGLMGSELVRLAAAGRIDIQRGRILVLNPVPTGDAELDAALESLLRARRPPRPTTWVGSPRRGILVAYLNRLAAAGAIRAERRRIFGTRYFIADPGRVAAARARLDGIALSAGMVDVAEAAFGGLAHAIALDRVLYKGLAGRPVRKRLMEMGKGQWTVAAVSRAAQATSSAMQAADAASSAATHAASHAATQAATHAATHAAAHQAGSHHGGAVGHH